MVRLRYRLQQTGFMQMLYGFWLSNPGCSSGKFIEI